MKIKRYKWAAIAAILFVPIITCVSSINLFKIEKQPSINKLNLNDSTNNFKINQNVSNENNVLTLNQKIKNSLTSFNKENDLNFQNEIQYEINTFGKVKIVAVGLTNFDFKDAKIDNTQINGIVLNLSINDNNELTITGEQAWENPIEEINYNFKTGAGSTPRSAIPITLLQGFWGDESPFKWNPKLQLEPILIKSNSKGGTLKNINFKILKTINGFNVPFSEHRFLGLHAGLLPSGSINLYPTINIKLNDLKEFTNKKITEKDFKAQEIYKYNKADIFNYVNAWFDVADEKTKKELIDGQKNVPWNFGDITSQRMPTLFNFNENLSILFSMDDINNLIKKFWDWSKKSPSSTGWQSAIEKFVIEVINKSKFKSYEDLLKIYDEYFSLSGGGTTQNGLESFKIKTNEMLKSNDNYEIKISDLKSHLKEFNIVVPNSVEDVNYPSNYLVKYKDLALLGQLTKGFFLSNDIKVDIDVSYTNKIDNQNITEEKKDISIYSHESKAIENSFLMDVVSDKAKEEVIEGKIKSIQNITFKNIRVVNDLTKKFLNLSTKNEDSKNFSGFSKIKNLSINYKADAHDFNSFSFAEWTKNKDAIGLDINKYLSEIIYLENQTEKNIWINDLAPGMKDVILSVLNGEYTYSLGNEEITPEIPVFLQSMKPIFKNEKYKFLTSIEGGVGKNDIDNFFKSVPEINKQDWLNVWNRFGISLDNSQQYPLFFPSNESQEFFIIGKVNNFFGNSDYEIIRNKLINNQMNNVNSIALINHNPISNNDYNGYFVIKLKTCLENNYDLKPSLLRKYNIIDDNSNNNLNDFIKKVLYAVDEENKPIYWIQKKNQTSNETFFENTSWTENKWSLNYNKVWYDLLENPEIRIISTEERKKAVEVILNSIESSFLIKMQEEYGEDSDFLEEIERTLKINTLLNSLNNSLTNFDSFLNSMPYVFNKELWNNTDAFIQYNNLFIDEQTNKQLIESNGFYKFFKKNEQDKTSKWSNEFIQEMFFNLYSIKSNLLTTTRNELQAPLSDYDKILINNFIKQFNKYKEMFNSYNNTNEGTKEYEQWLSDINLYLDSNNPLVIYKNEYQNIFFEIYGNKYIDNLINNVNFVGGNAINQNLLFSSIEEMINNEIVQNILKLFKLNVDDIVEKTPLKIGNNIVEGKYQYQLKDNFDLPFFIIRKTINGIPYYTFNNKDGNLQLEASLDFLNKISQLGYIDSNNRNFYSVLIDNKPLIDVLQKPNKNLTQLKTSIIADEKNQENFTKTLNVGSIVLVSVLPITIILIVILAVWLSKSKKRKLQF